MRKILYIQYNHPAAFPPLEHSSRLLADGGWKVLFLGVRSAGGADAIRFPPHESIRVRELLPCPPGLRQKTHFVWYTIWVLFWVIRWRPQWIYASDHLSAPTALILSYWPGLRILYHEHDSPTKTSGDSLFVRICYSARTRLARRCDLNILPNEVRAKHFASQTGATNVSCVWNCPARTEIQTARPRHAEEELWIIYHGSIVPARLPLATLNALKLLPAQVKLRIFGYETGGHSGYVRELRETANKLGLSERVEFHGAIPDRAQLLAWGRNSDVGLAFMPQHSDDINMRHMLGASNKPFDYLACGVALLVSGLDDWRKVYVEAGYGLACDPEDAESIAMALCWFWEHRTQTQRMGERGRQRIAEHWNYEAQFTPVFERINAAHAAANTTKVGVQSSGI